MDISFKNIIFEDIMQYDLFQNSGSCFRYFPPTYNLFFSPPKRPQKHFSETRLQISHFILLSREKKNT